VAARAGRGRSRAFLGYVDGRDELARLYGAADISLSVAPTETFGLAVLEALACGTPVVTADQGGARELVDDTCADWGQPLEQQPWPMPYSACTTRLVADPYALCQAARTRAELYSWDTSAQLMLDAHRDVSPGA
jgi:alpha-1,6-mannosyltransferase